MDFDPKIRFRPWQTALLGVVLATGLVFVFAPEVSLLGTSAEPQAGPPTPTTVVPSAPLATTGPEPQQIVPGQAPITRAPGLTTTGGPTYGPPLVQGAPGPAGLQPRSATTCVPQSSDVNLTALSFNIHSALGRGDRLGLSQIANEIRAWDPDVVLLQEVDRGRHHSAETDQPGYLAEQLGMEVAFGVNVNFGRAEYGVATLSKYPIVSQSNTHLPNDPSTREDQQRGVLNTQIQVGDSVISVYNTHLQHMKHYDGLRKQQMEAITGLMRNDPLPKILGGDLNSGPSSAVLSTARTVVKDAWDAVGAGAGTGKTAPAANPRGRIDFLLYSDPLVPQSSEVLFSEISDHRAVRTSFQLPASESPICVPVFDEPLS